MEHKRRSLGEALTTPEETAFLNTGKANPGTPEPENPTPVSHSAEKQAPQPSSLALHQGFQTSFKPRGRRVLTVQIEQHILDEVFRESLERKLQYIEPHTQRDIVSVALVEWLQRNSLRSKSTVDVV